MPITIRKITYQWLKSINIFKNPQIKIEGSATDVQVPYDEQIYLQNGYSVGLVLRKILQPNHPYQLTLMKVRKIATLKSSQNWEILQPVLIQLGFPLFSEEGEVVNISENTLTQILQFLKDEFGPAEMEHVKQKNRKRRNYIDSVNFYKQKPLTQSQNSLQFMCLLLTNHFNISIDGTLGLLINNSQNLKKVIVYGSNKDNFDGICNILDQIYQNWYFIQELMESQQDGYHKFMLGIVDGLLSQSTVVVQKTLRVLNNIGNGKWLMEQGYYKCLQSTDPSVFQFLLKQLQPSYGKVFNQKLHQVVKDKSKLFPIFLNLLSQIKRTLYTKNLLQCMPISYFLDQCFTVLSPEEIDEQQNQVKVLARQVLGKIVADYYDKIPYSYAPAIYQVYQYSMNRSYSEQYHLIIQLLQIIESLLHKESLQVEKYFKILMKYLQNTFNEIRNFIITSLKDIYRRMSQYFPLGCFLVMFSLDTIAQASEFQFFKLISEDAGTIMEDQLTLALSYVSYYYQKQIHCECFFPLLQKIISEYGKGAKKWGEQTYQNIIDKFQQINIPNFDNTSALNPKPPRKSQVTNSLGIKRREMLKHREYESFKKILILLKGINDKPFLFKYREYVGIVIGRLLKQFNRKKQSIAFLKKLFGMIKKGIENVHSSQSMDDIVKSILISKSKSKMSINQISGEAHSQQWEIQQSKMIEEDPQENKQDSSLQIEQKRQTNTLFQEREDVENEFLDHFEPQQVIPTPNMFKSPNLLLPFSDDQTPNHTLFLLDSYFEQYEIIYLRMIREKYKYVIEKSVQIYHTLNATKQENSLTQIMLLFLQKIGLKRYVEETDAEVLFIKSKILHTTQYQIIQEFVVQLSFLVFGFKSNRRINITCVQSLMKYIEDYLKENHQFVSQSQKSTHRSKRSFEVNRNMTFEKKFSKNIIQPKCENYFTCFEVLSEILQNGLGFHLLEPLAKVVNEMTQNSDNQKEGLVRSQLDNEIEELEKQVGEQKDAKEDKDKDGVEQKSYKRLFRTKNSNKPKRFSQKSLILEKKQDPLILINKITKRKVELGQELKKAKNSSQKKEGVQNNNE